jgi:hypothetical protein
MPASAVVADIRPIEFEVQQDDIEDPRHRIAATRWSETALARRSP